MARLSISQVPGSDPPHFIARNRDIEQSAPQAVVPSPYEWPVPDAGDEPLMAQLRWYLETFLSYPFEPYIARAAHIETALKAWGTAAFDALFDNRATGRWLSNEAGAVHDILISSDDPVLLAWPWEALHDTTLGYFGHRARIQRRLNHDVPEPPTLPSLPQDRIHILLITARPFEDDVEYHSISRPLVDLIRREKLPASVQVLRPPTFDALQKHLAANQGRYHILHFDGHGGYGAQTPGPNPGHFHGSEGRLLFERDDGTPDEITASRLATMLQGCTIPFVVLNACRSATLDAQAAEGRAFASVAGSLVKAGFRSVLAMAYNLTVTGAQQFLPAFYQCLFQQGSLLEAAREGRLRMFDHASRSAWNPDARLPDWLLPVVYQQRDDFDLSFAANAAPIPDTIAFPDEATVADPLGFVGRDAAIHALERALRRPAAGILIHGLGGIGKTTLLRHFLQWLRDTGGLAHPPFWFSFDDIRSASFVLNTIGRTLFGPQFDSDQPQQLASLTTALKDNPSVIVWDNFESARGFQTEHVSGLLPSGDAERLRDFLGALRDGKTKVLVTSRSDEAWLPDTHCRRQPLYGLSGAERWDYAARVLDELDVKVDRDDTDLRELMTELGGHPVLLRAVLPELKRHSAPSLRKQWQANLEKLLSQIDDSSHARLLASLDLVGVSFSETEVTYLIPIALHERYLHLDALHQMGEAVIGYVPEMMDHVVARLERTGLLMCMEQNVFALHPLLTSYLRSTGFVISTSGASQAKLVNEAWERAFVDVMELVANILTPKEFHEQRETFAVHNANFHHAIKLSSKWNLPTHFTSIAQSLASYAMNTRNWVEAGNFFKKLAEERKQIGDLKGEAVAYHQLGVIAQEQREFSAAECWYSGAVSINEKLNDESRVASGFHQLGVMAAEQRDFSAAERWCLKCLAISQQLKDETGVASSYQELGRMELLRGNDAAAEAWYSKSLIIDERLKREKAVVTAYFSLGSIAQKRQDFAAAESWFRKALIFFDRNRDELNAAAIYYQLGMSALMQRHLAAAEDWLVKAVTIFEKRGDDYRAAAPLNELAFIAGMRGDRLQSGSFFLRAYKILARRNDPYNANGTMNNFARVFREASAAERERLRAMGREALGDELMQKIELAANGGQK